jgi:PAS domain S-box-containing protein
MNTDLVNYILGKEKMSALAQMDASQGIVHDSNDGILLASATGMTDYVNPALCRILGYSPEQLLGQQLTVIFEDGKRKELDDQVQLMRNRQSASIYEAEMDCKANDNTLVQCLVMIMFLSHNDSHRDDLVLVIKDNSKIHEQRIESELAKSQSEKLLYAILPRGIVARLNEGEKDVTFTVADASIMFVDIVKFSDFSTALTPQEIMGTLSAIFGAFDDRIQRSKAIIKIKLIGDIYMCASGLFDQLNASKNAEELVLFALDCLQTLDDLNMKLNVSLKVRIGINSGGPIIAGVLGTDNRVFDIIGDAINVAARLQSTSLENTIQMSESTYLHIAHLGLPVKQRDKVFLKGKGEVSTYMLENAEFA